MKTQVIEGVTWEVVNGDKAPKTWERLKSSYTHHDGFSVREAYVKPSYKKVQIEKWWRDYSYNLGGVTFHICSHSSHVFTLGFSSLYGIHYVTPSHNYLLV